MDKEDVVYVCMCVCVCVCIYNRTLLNHKKKNEVMPFAATWMDLEVFILSEISLKKKTTI